ncbi:MAG TPA: right-handed parallel beta-helix repeat-containing protein [Blastocatellia bacterium]|nr:right-handed parallel beta-helix repeat-containing protein [Blastocatellia bacterium]
MTATLRYLFTIAGMIVCWSAPAMAGTFYIATNGSDAGAGSSTQPWATLQHAVDTLGPGDTVLVESGTYAGCRIGHSGLAGAVCTLKADSGAHVVVNSAGPANKHGSNVEVELFDDTVRYWVIDGIESAGSSRYGIDIRVTEFITVQNCFVHNSALTGIFLAFSYHPAIIYNESSLNGEHGVYQSNSGDYPVVRGNRLHHNAAAGLHMNGDRNFTPGDGIISFAVVEKNIVYENGAQGGSGINCDGVSDSIIRNNLLYNNHASGISLYAIDGAEGSSRNLVYNNTIVMAQGARWCVNIPASTEGQPNPTANKIKNNILYTADSNRGSVVTYSAAPPGFESDYNVVVNRFSTDDGDSGLPLSGWRAEGLDLHSIVSSPSDLFVNPASGDYHLKANSPATAAGLVLAQVTDDLDGSVRPPRVYSIGCFEAQPGPSARDFSPAALNVETGRLLSGDPTSVVTADRTYLKVKAVRLDGTFADVITYDFQLPAASASTLNVTSVSHVSAGPQRQQIMLYNFSTGAWVEISDSVLPDGLDTTTTVPVPGAGEFISSAGLLRVQVRTGDMSTFKWKHFVDLIRVTALP